MIEYDPKRMYRHLSNAGVWPAGDTDEPGVSAARQWWLNLLSRIADSVNERDWDVAREVEDAVNDITGEAVAGMVAEARKGRALFNLCELSDLDDFPYDEEIDMRLTQVITADPTQGMHRHARESEDEHNERKARARSEHADRVERAVGLKAVLGVYLEAAAEVVASAWCAELAAEAVYEAEGDEDE